MRPFGGQLVQGTLIFTATLTLLMLRFLVPEPVGAADNGDGWRLLCRLGARELDRPIETAVRFEIRPGEPCRSEYVSTQLWLYRLAQFVGRGLGDDAVLNLIIVGTISCVLVTVAIALIVMAIPLTPRQRTMATGLLFLVIADAAFFGYFASALSEGAVFIGIPLTVAGLLLIRRGGWSQALGALVTSVGAVVAVNAKAPTLLILPPLLLVLLLIWRWERPAKPALPLGVMIVVAGCTYWMQASSSEAANAQWGEINSYHVIFDSIVDGKHDTQGDLAALGLPASFERFVGTTWWMPSAAPHDPEYLPYRERITRRNVAKYYLTHPVRTVQILHKGAQDMLTARSSYVGSFGEHTDHPPRAQEHRVSVLSGLTGLVAPAGLFLVAPLWLLIGWATILACRRCRPNLGMVCLFLLATAVGQFLLAALAEGIEGTKHQLPALFCTLLAGVLASLSRLPPTSADSPIFRVHLPRLHALRNHSQSAPNRVPHLQTEPPR